jgi:TolA-binding protein
MAEQLEKPNGPSKSFMTVGPTLHYSHSNVRRCWGLAIGVYIASCLFWSKMMTGNAIAFEFGRMINPDSWGLGQFVLSPLSIYEYPWQILTLGLVMGILAVAPLLVSQLLSFRYSIVMIAAVMFIARLEFFGLFLLVACVAVACRPLRFRSRIIAIALCMAPQVAYWAIFGGTESVDPVRWSFSYAPWFCAWLTGLWVAGAVIGIGHFTRYRPGLVWSVSGFALVIAMLIFWNKVSFSELDYQLYVAGNNPEEVREFHDHSMTEAIDEAMNDPSIRSFLAGLFYPTEPILLREDLKKEIQVQLGYNRWPNWFKAPEELNYQAKRQQLLSQYNLFIDKRPTSKRMPIALYYKAILNEFSPDIRLFGQRELLHFYSSYPHRENLPIWYKLYNEFPQSSEAIEARWRIAMHIAGQGEFEKAKELCEVAAVMLQQQIQGQKENAGSSSGFFMAFSESAQTVMTERKLRELEIKLKQLQSLINGQNHDDSKESKERLARFVILNPHGRDYSDRLDALLSQTKEKDPLRDNISLAKIILIEDAQLRSEQLKALTEKYADTDGGIRALYELGLLNIVLWKNSELSEEIRESYLTQARTMLTSFISLYPKSIYRDQAQSKLDNLPVLE